MERLNWREYFLEILHAVQKRASCDRGRSGAIIVRDKHILCTGYVGAPPGALNCEEEGHDMDVFYRKNNTKVFDIPSDFIKEVHCIRSCHAEINAIAQAAKLGVAIKDATIYCTMVPCHSCTKAIIASGIVYVIAEYDYQSSKKSKELFKICNVTLEVINENKELY